MYEAEGIDSRVSSSESAQKISSRGIDRDYFLLRQYDAEDIKHVQLYDMLARWWEGQGAEEGGAQMNLWTTVPRLTTKVSSLHPLKVMCVCGGVWYCSHSYESWTCA